MYDNHPDDRELLYLAFPKPDRKVDEAWAQHVLSCPQCMNDIMNMRAMAEIISSLDEEDDDNSEKAPIPGHSEQRSYGDYSGAGSAPMVAAAAQGVQAQTNVDYNAYLDTDAEEILSYQNDSDEEDNDITLEIHEIEGEVDLGADFFDAHE